MASSSILVLCSAFSADASDPVIDLPDVIVKGGILCFALSSRSHHAGLVRKRVSSPLLSSPDFELV